MRISGAFENRVSLPSASSPQPTDKVPTRLERIIPELVTGLPLLLDEVRELLAEDWPDYAEFLAAEHDLANEAAATFMRRLVRLAEHGLAEVPQEPVPAPDAETELFEQIGRVQWREGRDISVLLSAYQVGARVAWRHVSAIALQLGVTPQALAALAEAVFIFIDQLSSASAHGFVLEQSEAAVTRERLRDELVELLLSDRSDTVAVRAAAIRAGWPLPREAAVLLVDPANPAGQEILARLDTACLPIRRHGALL